MCMKANHKSLRVKNVSNFTNALLLILLFFVLVANFSAKAQFSADERKDTTIILLSDITVQLQCAQALNDLYNFKFPEAESKFLRPPKGQALMSARHR